MTGLGWGIYSQLKDPSAPNTILPILNNADSFWVCILKAKHEDLHPWCHSNSSTLSRSRRNINLLTKDIRLGFRKLIRDGRTTNIWTDPRIDNISFSFWPTMVIGVMTSFWSLLQNSIGIRFKHFWLMVIGLLAAGRSRVWETCF